MFSFLRIFTALGALGIALCTAAQAADMGRNYPPLPPSLEVPPLPVEEFGSGWYLRGDVGYRKNTVDSVSNVGTTTIVSDSLDNSWVAGIGAGLKWQWLRADLTLDYGTRAKYRATTDNMADDFTANIDSFTTMANAYGDLGTWYGFTPYIGAGVGVAHVSAADFTQNFFAPVPAAGTGSKWNLAWAYMAGVSYAVTPKFNVDLGYRHINMGNVSTGMDDYGNQLTFHGVAADEIRLGIRYLID